MYHEPLQREKGRCHTRGMNFHQAERYLLRQRRWGVKLGLRNMRSAMDLLGRPERDFFPVAVAGSKGKGSVCAFLESILTCARCPTGLYTSPHLVHVGERIRVNGRAIGERDFALLLSRLRRALGGGEFPLTYFEWLTTMAIRRFSELRLPLALFEVGLGGRLDATNVVPARIAIVTEIEKEHSEYLGSTLAEIAREKCGIIKKGSVVLSGATSPAARREISSAARRRGGRLRWLDGEAQWEVTGHTVKGVQMSLATEGDHFGNLRLGILGRHQARNAALAVLAAGELRRRGFSIGKRDIRQGLARARWPGRCEYRPGRPALFLDGAHTPASARALAASVEDLFPRRRRVLIFGALRDKNISALAAVLFPGVEGVVLVRPPEERGAEPGEVLRRLPPKWRKLCRVADDPPAALEHARKAAGGNGIVVVAGSLFLVGAILQCSGQERG